MKRVLITMFFIILMIIPAKSFAEDIQIKINGTRIETADPIVVGNGRIMVRYNSFCKQLGIHAEWDIYTRELTYKKERGYLKLKLEAQSAVINDQYINMEHPIFIQNYILYVPLRFVAESFNASVEWDGDTRTVNITSAPIVFLGDSITENYQLNEYFKDVNVNMINKGVNANITLDVLRRLDDVVSLKPSKIFIMIGTNDVWGGFPDEFIISNYTSILDRIKQECPFTKIYVQSIVPMGANQLAANIMASIEKIDRLNNELAAISEVNGYNYIDIGVLFKDSKGELAPVYTTDGIHLSAKAYELWTQTIKSMVIDD